jgi:hypothetical protein
MITCAIMQPTFAPWAGYFNLIYKARHFVFLDDVQFEKQSWQSRNRVLVNGEPHWLSVPLKGHSLEQKISEVTVSTDLVWRTKQIKLLENVYAKEPYKKDLAVIFDIISDATNTTLCGLNTKIIQAVSEKLNIKSSFYFASQLQVEGARSERLIKICQKLGAQKYLSPVGAQEYLKEDAVFESEKCEVKLEFHQYEPQSYAQGSGETFISHLSILDIIPRLGWDATARYVGVK